MDDAPHQTSSSSEFRCVFLMVNVEASYPNEGRVRCCRLSTFQVAAFTVVAFLSASKGSSQLSVVAREAHYGSPHRRWVKIKLLQALTDINL